MEQMEKEKEAILIEMEQLKDEKAILKNELDERLREIHRLRVGSTPSICTNVCCKSNPKLSLTVLYPLDVH